MENKIVIINSDTHKKTSDFINHIKNNLSFTTDLDCQILTEQYFLNLNIDHNSVTCIYFLGKKKFEDFHDI